MSSQLANRLWAAIGQRPKQEGVNVVQVAQTTWRTQPSGPIKPAHGYAYTAAFAAALVGVLAYPGNYEEVQKFNDWIESLKVLWGNISFLDFCGSAMTCFAFRRSHEQAIERNDKKVLALHASPLAHYATTILTCTFLQFGGTTVTGVFLGQNPSWCAGTHVWSAFLLAWWLTFSAPGDLWYRAMKAGPLLFLPVKLGQTISSGHAMTSWGVEKALTAEHVKMRGSVWGALACGFFSSSFGWVVVEYCLAGGAGLQAACPSWAMQRGYYLVLLYYALTDPHGVLRLPRQAGASLLTPLSPVLGAALEGEAWGKSEAKVAVLACNLVLMFGQDFGGVDLLLLLNKGMAAVARVAAPINMQTHYTPPPEPAAAAASKLPAVAAKHAEGKAATEAVTAAAGRAKHKGGGGGEGKKTD